MKVEVEIITSIPKQTKIVWRFLWKKHWKQINLIKLFY